MRERAAATAAGAAAQGQHDFHEIAEDFERRWLLTYHAWEEDDDAERKKLIRMTLPEVRAVIALKIKKRPSRMWGVKRLGDGMGVWRATRPRHGPDRRCRSS